VALQLEQAAHELPFSQVLPPQLVQLFELPEQVAQLAEQAPQTVLAFAVHALSTKLPGAQVWQAWQAPPPR
jgi:hypothetical protein